MREAREGREGHTLPEIVVGDYMFEFVLHGFEERRVMASKSASLSWPPPWQWCDGKSAARAR